MLAGLLRAAPARAAEPWQRDPVLSRLLVKQLLADPGGLLWVATDEGMFRYDGYDGYELLPLGRLLAAGSAAAPQGLVRCLCLDAAGALKQAATQATVGATGAARPAWPARLTNGGCVMRGNHTATQDLNLGSNALTGTGASISGVGVGVRADGGLNLSQNVPGGNVLVGYQAGQRLDPGGSGAQNYFAGYTAGKSTATGSYNTFTGAFSGVNNTTGTRNTFSGT